MTSPIQPSNPDYSAGDPSSSTGGYPVASGAEGFGTEASYPTTGAEGFGTGTGYASTTDYGYQTSTTPSTGGTQSAAETAKETAKQTAGTVKQEASQVKDTALSAGADVAQTAKEQAGQVLGETKAQATNLLHQARGEVSSQASSQLSRLAESLHGLSKELGSMASKAEDGGPMTDLVHQASQKGGEIAHWLSEHEPSDVLEEVRRFARRRPMAFLLGSLVAGIVAGRVTRGAVAANASSSSETPVALGSTNDYATSEFATTSQPTFTPPYDTAGTGGYPTSTYPSAGTGTYPATDGGVGQGTYQGTTSAYPASGTQTVGGTSYGSGEPLR